MKLNCAIIDDEPLAVELMAGYVRKTPFLTLCGSFGSGSAAFDMLRDRPVDLLFCDIQMPGLSGMELSRMLPADTRVIFTTAFSRYAVEGFRVNAVDYLLKPISYADFLAAANKALAWFELKNRAETPPPAAAPQSLFVKTEYRLRQIGFDYIFDTVYSADLTIMEEGSEFVERFTHRDQYSWPMFTSCCPGWVRFVKGQFPQFAKNLSTAKSPLPPLLQKIQPRVPRVPSRLGQDIRAFRAIL